MVNMRPIPAQLPGHAPLCGRRVPWNVGLSHADPPVVSACKHQRGGPRDGVAHFKRHDTVLGTTLANMYCFSSNSLELARDTSPGLPGCVFADAPAISRSLHGRSSRCPLVVRQVRVRADLQTLRHTECGLSLAVAVDCGTKVCVPGRKAQRSPDRNQWSRWCRKMSTRITTGRMVRSHAPPHPLRGVHAGLPRPNNHVDARGCLA